MIDFATFCGFCFDAILYFRCVGEVRKLAVGGGHSAVLTDAFSLKELCEFRLADSVTLSNAAEIEDVASRTGSDALARFCERLRYWFPFLASSIGFHFRNFFFIHFFSGNLFSTLGLLV